jgi:ribosome recycling factor
MATGNFDINELKRRMQGAIQSLKHELGGLRTGRASASMLDPVQVDAYGTHMPLNQVATVSVPEPRLISVQVWDKSMVKAVEKAIVDSNLGLSPATEGQVLRLRIPELNQERRKELVKVAHKYAEEARIAVRHVRRDGMDILKKLEKSHEMSEDDQERHADRLIEGDPVRRVALEGCPRLSGPLCVIEQRLGQPLPHIAPPPDPGRAEQVQADPAGAGPQPGGGRFDRLLL